MKGLQARYAALQLVNFVATCAVCVFAAVFLQSRGMNNTQVGVVTAGGCVLSVVLGPVLSRLVSGPRRVPIIRLLAAMFASICAGFLAIVLLPVPGVLLMSAYMLAYAGLMATPPLFSQLCMEYIAAGRRIDFGLCRGMGSVGYAVSAAAIGAGVSALGPNVLAPILGISCLAMLLLLKGMPREGDACAPICDPVKVGERQGVGSIGFFARYRVIGIALVGFGFVFSSSACLSTYLINIVEKLGGDSSLYGIGIFAMAMTELPAMVAVVPLRKKLGVGGLLVLAGAAYLARNCLIALALSLPLLFVGLLLQGVSYGTLSALFTYWVDEACRREDQMIGQTLVFIVSSGIGATVGNLVGGVLQDAWGMGAMSLFAVAVSLIGAALLCASGFAVVRKK